jgi:DNA-binding SARP family transcriptional activator/tetratricopeptide (TPR) repeat protein
MDFRILGPLEVREGDQPIPLAGGRQRAVLALLILNANETVSTDRLVEELWGERAPATAPKVVQNHVSQLRRALGDGLLVTHGAGYTLRLEPGSVDLDRFERLLQEGRRALAGGDAEQASDLLSQALSLWRGPPLADFAFESFAQTEIARLEERRLVALEERIDADLALGRHADLVGELEALVRDHPRRERLHCQLMLCLYRSGRQAEALDVYQAARKALVEELGIDPGRRLRELHQAILRQDPALELAGAGPAAEPTPETARGAFVGRAAELAELVAGLDDALAGHGRLFLLVGEPGIGKSRLADELITHARARGARVLVGRCWEAGGAPAYWPWVQSLRAYVRESEIPALRSQLGDGAADLAQIVPELRQRFPELADPPSLESEGARFRLFDATAEFLRNASESRSILLVLDDLHAADASSLLLLQFIARQLGSTRMLLLCAYRDVDPIPGQTLTALLAEVAREPVTRRLSLGGLSEREVAEYLELTASEMASPELVAALHEETEGNPLFVAETVRLLTVEGVGAESAAATVAIPQSVRDVIARRLTHLSDECNRVLVLASVLGREFALDALARLSGVSEEELLDMLDEAMAARVVSDVPGGPGRLRFAHVLFRDTLYEGLTTVRRVRIHRHAIEAIETLYGDEPGPHLAELAHHSIAGSEFDKALPYAKRAGDRALALLAYEESARLYETALEALDLAGASDEEMRCELLLRLGDAQARAGDVPAAKKTFLRAAEAARSAVLPDQLARAALGYGGRFVWSRAWCDAQLIPLLEEALTALPDEDSELRARLLARLTGGPLRDTLAREPRVAMSQQAVDIARRLGDPATLAYALEGRYETDWSPDVLEERLATANELIEVAESTGDAERAYAGHDCRFYALIEAGDVPAAYQDHEVANRLAHQLRQPAQLWDTVTRGAFLALFEGRFEEAEAAIHEALELGRLAQSANAQQAFDLQMYALRREQGRLREVVEVVERAVDDYPAYPVWRYVLADVFAQLGRMDDARATLDVLAADAFPAYAAGGEMQWLCSISLLPEVCRDLRDAVQAATLYKLLFPHSRLNAVTPPELCLGSVSRGLGILAATMSKWPDALQHFEDALEMNATTCARPWLAYSQYDYAYMLLARGNAGDRERADDLLASARTLSQELGMSALAEKISALSK